MKSRVDCLHPSISNVGIKRFVSLVMVCAPCLSKGGDRGCSCKKVAYRKSHRGSKAEPCHLEK
eukprot:6213177-Amphidinium_carterae.1